MSVVLNFKSHPAELFAQALREVALGHIDTSIVIEHPKQAAHGDYACNPGNTPGSAIKIDVGDIYWSRL